MPPGRRTTTSARTSINPEERRPEDDWTDAPRRRFGLQNGRADTPPANERLGLVLVWTAIIAAPGNLGPLGVFASRCRLDINMTSSDEYRRRAGECLLFAQYVSGEKSRNLLLQMALGWHDLAERAEQLRPQQDVAHRDRGKSRA